MPRIQAVPSTSRQQNLVDVIRRMILVGDIPGGARLKESDLAEQLRVSRTPIREALTTLAHERLIEYRFKRSYVVRKFTVEDVTKAFSVREVLEGLAARLAAEAGLSPVAKQGFEECLHDADAALLGEHFSRDDRERIRLANEKFHILVIESAHNDTLTEAWMRATNMPFISSSILPTLEAEPKDLFKVRVANAQHRAVFESLFLRDAHGAQLSMQSHVNFVADGVKSKCRLLEMAESARSMDVNTVQPSSVARAMR